MDAALGVEAMTTEQDRRIADAIGSEQSRLRNFIRKRVADEGDAEDILQDVFYELIEAYRMMKPIERVGAWLFRVARNRITDLFRRKKTTAAGPIERFDDGELLGVEDLLPSTEAGPDAVYARGVLIEELSDALGELPDEQREVFVAHELEGLSFKEIAARTGVGVNTLLSRKHYAVVYLRHRLQSIYDEYEE